MFTFSDTVVFWHIYTLILNLFGHFYYSQRAESNSRSKKKKNLGKYLPLSTFIIGRGHKATKHLLIEVIPCINRYLQIPPSMLGSEESKSSEDTVSTLWSLMIEWGGEVYPNN